MAKTNNSPEEKKNTRLNYEDDLFIIKKERADEIESDGSASAFDETERVSEDNFDDLSEK
jgi:hypothetical protein